MNTKTYNFIKYIATLGALFLFLAPFLGFLQEWSWANPSWFHNNQIFKSPTALAATLWILEIVGILLIISYVYIRTRLKDKSGYQYTKEEEKKLNISFAMYAGEILFSFIYVIITCGIFKNGEHHSGLMIAFAPIYVSQFVMSIFAAIFESWSRIGEQAYLYQRQEELKDKKDISVSKTGTKRTSEAQALLSDDEPKKKSKKPQKEIKHKSEEYIDDEKTLEDFFNEDSDDEKNK